MENATKALLIAGAVLVSILIIGIGMLIYQSVTGTVNSGLASMDQQEIQMFNAQFTKYVGDRVTGSRVKALISEIKASNTKVKNETNNDATDPRMIPESTLPATVNTAKTYKVEVKDNNGDGLMNDVVITVNTP